MLNNNFIIFLLLTFALIQSIKIIMKTFKFYLVLLIALIFYSCGNNEEISAEAAPKSTTYTENVSADELLTQLKAREPELAQFIEENPFTNFKTNKGKTDYYLDLEHIVAVKNNQNEAVYSIPLYMKSDVGSPYLYTLSVAVNPENIYTNLITKEPLDNDTFNYYGSSFNIYKKNSQTAKTNLVDCYCTKVYTDCACHSVHAASGCDHPAVIVTCGCSGSGGSSGYIPPSVPTGGDLTSWNGGLNSPTTYAPTGDGIYIALRKHFRPDYEFTPLEKYNIINQTAYSSKLIDFLNAEGSTPINKAFVLQMLKSMEDGIFAMVKQLTFSINNFLYSQKSPFNVDLNSIFENASAAENKKFLEIYDALSKSAEFKKLFLNLFGNNTRYNVKFEIVDAVYDSNDPTKEVNANTDYDSSLPYILIKINKKKLNDSSIKQTRIENARTIIHEFIHAYLFTITNNPIVGPTDIASLLNKKYPNGKEQHDFMYDNMTPTITKILTESRDLLTYPAGRMEVESLKIYTKKDLSTHEIWNWEHYFKYISIEGLTEATSYKTDFPKDSDAENTFIQYRNFGHTWLDKK